VGCLLGNCVGWEGQGVAGKIKGMSVDFKVISLLGVCSMSRVGFVAPWMQWHWNDMDVK